MEPKLLNISAPKDMEAYLGCSRSGRFAIFSWLDGFNTLQIFEGKSDEFGEEWNWSSFLKRDKIAQALKDYCLQAPRNGDTPHALILDKETRKLWICENNPYIFETIINFLSSEAGAIDDSENNLNEPVLTSRQVDEMLLASKEKHKEGARVISLASFFKHIASKRH